jgi:nucleotide-binding universal stress UspA family protein
MLKLLIAVDGSEHAHRAIDAAARLAKETTVECVLVHVREGAEAYHGDITPRDYERIGAEARTRQDAILAEALTYARQAGLVDATTLAQAGSPEVDLPNVATQRGVDMIVMGTRGLGTMGALLLGSVAQRVVHHATVPVLLVK